MTLLHLTGGILGVTLWFALVALALRRFAPDQRPVQFRIQVVEAVFLTLFAALWFASLGHGAWWVLFIVLGLLIEGPVRARHLADPAVAHWKGIVIGTLRLVVAGGILSLLL